jgi:hypothetical protein
MMILSRFKERFRGLLRAHGIFVTGEKDSRGKVVGKARTIRSAATDENWKDHLGGKAGLGIVPINEESRCWFGAVDVDEYDLNVNTLEEKVRKLGLPLVVCRTKSGGAHLYLFLTEPVEAQLARSRLSEWAVALGLPKVEIFPKQSKLAGPDDNGNWINLPYFGGELTERYAVREGKALGQEEFLNLADATAVDEGRLRSVVVEADAKMEGAPPCLRYFVTIGFPEHTRNLGLFDLAVYCKMRHGEEWEKELQDMNRRFLVPPLGKTEVDTIIKSVRRRQYFYRCKEPPIVSACNRLACQSARYGMKDAGDDPGVIMDNLTKILTDPPIWIMGVDGKRIEFSCTSEMLNQRIFHARCVERVHVFPRMITQNAWREIIQRLLDKVEEIEAPEDAGIGGEFREMFREYMTQVRISGSRETLLLGNAYSENGQVFFRSNDLMAWMKKRRTSFSSKEAWGHLRILGVQTREFKIKGRFVRTWAVPGEEGSEPLTVDPIPREEM